MENSSTLAVLHGSPVRPITLVDGWERKTLGREGGRAEMESGHGDRTCLGITS